KVIIDCDVGVDDAQAIMIALSQDSIEILAITTVTGNQNTEQATNNTLKVLDYCGERNIPVYKGITEGLTGRCDFVELSAYHGQDGLGDAQGLREPDRTPLKDKHAVLAMIDLVKANPGEASIWNKISILALAPLTNLAIAGRLDPTFLTNVKAVHMMGGNKHAVGNHLVTAEFNFGADPEAAHIVLNEFKCNMSLITWEFTLENPMTWAWFDEYAAVNTTKGRFIYNITRHTFENGGPYITCDPFTVAVVARPDIITKSKMVYLTVELDGRITRGQVVVDWRGVMGKPPNVLLIENVDMSKFKRMMLDSVDAPRTIGGSRRSNYY
ncbi:predicted protein, partial [Nematostella vectensis]